MSFLFCLLATLQNSENKTIYKGTFEVTNLSEEHDPKDVDVRFL